jgi:hypothetical protein
MILQRLATSIRKQDWFTLTVCPRLASSSQMAQASRLVVVGPKWTSGKH